ncbi:MAG: hypothetical protein IJG51_11950 [Synergistaceae bacterium]|nr:hypothetical protein [Synergistaceae bacterium]MBQ3345461.1 hypothetical protein [Synergistaceae bacterium]MBQ3399594.1 hypothetical protein [Synergistaceae bacterium]MBQ3757912.1 hypothetical protein [Synergistaceae bacterium]MBQ4402559.1 hypothetical protein [Synergistaceae bacterium]
MNTDEVDEVVKVMDLMFRTVYHKGREIVYDTREEAERARQKFSLAHQDNGAAKPFH